jgi:hypothetical protein
MSELIDFSATWQPIDALGKRILLGCLMVVLFASMFVLITGLVLFVPPERNDPMEPVMLVLICLNIYIFTITFAWDAIRTSRRMREGRGTVFREFRFFGDDSMERIATVIGSMGLDFVVNDPEEQQGRIFPADVVHESKIQVMGPMLDVRTERTRYDVLTVYLGPLDEDNTEMARILQGRIDMAMYEPAQSAPSIPPGIMMEPSAADAGRDRSCTDA